VLLIAGKSLKTFSSMNLSAGLQPLIFNKFGLYYN
jgi:hypothetical protein